MQIRTATIKDLNELIEIEQECFPVAEAASRESMEQRLSVFPECFWILEDNDKIVSFVNGMVTKESNLLDEMYEDANIHTFQGDWQMIFGVDTRVEYRKQGYAAQLLEYVIEQVRNQNRKGIVLTCKEKLIPYYAKFGFENEGISCSTHGDVIWYQMRLCLK